MSEQWYRNRDWSPEIEAEFEKRIARGRSQKAQHLMIQGMALIPRHPDVAARLLERSIALDDEFQLNQAYCQLALARLARGDVEGALQAYEAALEAQLKRPNIQTGAPLDYAFTVAWFERSERYELALTILEAVALSQTKGNIEFFARVSEKNWTLLKLFASYGYKTNLSFLIMEVDLSQPPDIPSWPAGICVRTFISNQDEQATYLVDEEASADKGYHQPLDFDAWARRMRLNDEIFDPSLWFLAHEENSTEIAGVALNLYHSESNTGWIDHLGVRRPWRNKGMGKALLLHSFSEFYRRGIQRIKLSVDSRSLTNSLRLYERVGMKTLQQYHIYTKQVVRDAGLA